MAAAFAAIAALQSAVFAQTATTAPAAGETEISIEAITKPSMDVTMTFLHPGRIAKFMVKEGESVKAGDVLVQQDDSAERAQLAQLKAEADDEIRVQAAEAQLAQKKVDLAKTEQARKGGGATDLEVQHARLEVTIGELSKRLAEFEHTQAGLKYDETRLQVERMRLMAPFDGQVQKQFLQVGESADSQTNKVLRMVNIDPLWIDVPVPTQRVRQGLALGDTVQVTFPEAPGKTCCVAGKIILISPVADAASQRLIVRVEAANKDRRPAGEHVMVIIAPVQAQNASAAGSENVDK